MFGHRDPELTLVSGAQAEPVVSQPLTQTFKFRFRYVTDSTLNPMVGMVVTTSPIWRRELLASVLSTRPQRDTALETDVLP
jgi:hypothetical protein